MFKDCMSSPVNFSKYYVYARWRILEKELSGESNGNLSLVFEILPLEKSLERYDAEIVNKYLSSSNVAISLLSIPLGWRKPNFKNRLFTTPCIVIGDGHTRASDGNIRMSMASIRDLLRRGRSSEGKAEHLETVSSPVVLLPWGRVERKLFMQEEVDCEIVDTGEIFCSDNKLTCWYS